MESKDLSRTFVHSWQKKIIVKKCWATNTRIRRARIYRAHLWIRGKKIIVKKCWAINARIRRAWIYRAHLCICGKKISVAKKIIVKKCWATNALIRRAWIYRAHSCICGKKSARRNVGHCFPVSRVQAGTLIFLNCLFL